MFAFKCFTGLAPVYLSDLISHYKPSRKLPLSSSNNLAIPRFKLSSYGPRACSVAPLLLWNTFPIQLKSESSLDVFKCKLKTFLFKHVHK